MSKRDESPKRVSPHLELMSQAASQPVFLERALASLPRGRFACGLCHHPDCRGTCGKNQRWPLTWYPVYFALTGHSYPMHVVFGPTNSQVDLRCCLCTGRVVAIDGKSKLPLEEQEGDPVCRRSRGEGGSLAQCCFTCTTYFRTAIQDFWAAEVPDGD